MKKIILKLVRIALLFTLLIAGTILLHAQQGAPPPPPPNPAGGGNGPVGGSAPVGEGLILLLLMGATYGGKKLYHLRK